MQSWCCEHSRIFKLCLLKVRKYFVLVIGSKGFYCFALQTNTTTSLQKLQFSTATTDEDHNMVKTLWNLTLSQSQKLHILCLLWRHHVYYRCNVVWPQRTDFFNNFSKHFLVTLRNILYIRSTALFLMYGFVDTNYKEKTNVVLFDWLVLLTH